MTEHVSGAYLSLGSKMAYCLPLVDALRTFLLAPAPELREVLDHVPPANAMCGRLGT
jgi:hypothetical protein